MTRKRIAALGIVVVLLVSLAGTAAAQTGTTPTVTPTPTATDDAAETTLYTHPIVQILAAYFGQDAMQEPQVTETPVETSTETPVETSTETPVETSTETPTTEPTVTETPTAEPTVTETPTSEEDLAKEIEAYHEDGMGFGVLVKLYSMAQAAKIACPTTPAVEETPVPSDGSTTVYEISTPTPCTPVTVDQLVQEFKSGTGMGQLFKEYGKPSLLGVGHVKQALREQQAQGATLEPTSQATLEGSNETYQPGAQNKNQKNQKDNKTKQHGNPNKVK